MREILFKGKSALSGKWAKGFFIKGKDGAGQIQRFKDGKEYITRVVPDTVSQFTGFYDMYGEKLFEGDILECKYPDDSGFVCRLERVIWNNGWYQQDGECPPEPMEQWHLNEYAVLVGNIWDNPELLEVKDNG